MGAVAYSAFGTSVTTVIKVGIYIGLCSFEFKPCLSQVHWLFESERMNTRRSPQQNSIQHKLLTVIYNKLHSWPNHRNIFRKEPHVSHFITLHLVPHKRLTVRHKGATFTALDSDIMKIFWHGCHSNAKKKRKKWVTLITRHQPRIRCVGRHLSLHYEHAELLWHVKSALEGPQRHSLSIPVP